MTNAREQSQHGHVFRPSPFHRPRAYWLDGAVLHWRIGSEEGHVQLADIASMRLDLAAGPGRGAICVLTEKSGRTHRFCNRYWPCWTREERHGWGRLQWRDATFRGLAFTLARRLRKANREAVIEAGPGRGRWILASIAAALAALIVVAGIARMITHREFETYVAILVALATILLTMLWPIIRAGGARALDPETLHDANPPSG